jgi:hypothetical protein
MIVRAFNFKVDTCITDRAFQKLRPAFPGRLDDLPSLHAIHQRAAALSGLSAVRYDCCTNSCICYAGPHSTRTECPHCRSHRYGSNGQPLKQFTYFPLIPRLKSMALNQRMAKLMTYRHEFTHVPGTYKDIFSAAHYQHLRTQSVSTDSSTATDPPQPIFGDPRDVALALSTDGFCPFKRRKQSCWPLILFNLNLPPDIRFHLENIICVGVIPGPKAVKDIDSFLYPLVEELLKLEAGVSAYDVSGDVMFLLRAFLILVFGDMPAVAKLMNMKGHNGKSPCRACNITGIRIPGSDSPIHYIPLYRPNHPDQPSYDPLHLVRRTHNQFLEQARKVEHAATTAESDRLSMLYGIKRRPLLSRLSGISLPCSMPHDFMHLIWENLIPNLLKLWTGTFKEMDTGSEDYKLPLTVQAAVAAAAAASGSTIPAAFSCRVPNFLTARYSFSAEAWSFWGLYLGPILLRGRFKKEKFYKHFIKLIRLLHICLQWSISALEVEQLRNGFADWVTEYER